MSELMNYIKSRFKDFEPFMYDEITSAGYSLEEAEELVKAGGLKKLYEDAYYYTESEELRDVEPDPTAYAYCKYIYRCGRWIGYYNDLTLDNRIKISLQYPFKVFIATNLVSRYEERLVDYLEYIFIPPFAPVTNENIRLQQLLDILYRRSYRNIDKEERKSLLSFVTKNNITLAAVKEFINNECREEVRTRLLENLYDSKIFSDR